MYSTYKNMAVPISDLKYEPWILSKLLSQKWMNKSNIWGIYRRRYGLDHAWSTKIVTTASQKFSIRSSPYASGYANCASGGGSSKKLFSTTNANHGVTGLLVLIRGIF